MQLHDLQPKSRSDKKRVGRGGARGKTSGRGHKGQLARAGGTPRPQIRDRIKKIPKLRGYQNNPVGKQSVAVNLADFAHFVEENDFVSPQFLVNHDVIEKSGGQAPKVKILGDGEIDTAITVVRCAVSSSAEEKITAAGGEVRE